jgi:hypothetical protein
MRINCDLTLELLELFKKKDCLEISSIVLGGKEGSVVVLSEEEIAEGEKNAIKDCFKDHLYFKDYSGIKYINNKEIYKKFKKKWDDSWNKENICCSILKSEY